MLPKDIHMLVSFLNTKLRDDDMSLEHIIEVSNGNYQEIVTTLTKNNYIYDDTINQIKLK